MKNGYTRCAVSRLCDKCVIANELNWIIICFVFSFVETGAVFTLGKSYLSENHQSYFFIKNDPIKKLITGSHQSAVICGKHSNCHFTSILCIICDSLRRNLCFQNKKVHTEWPRVQRHMDVWARDSAYAFIHSFIVAGRLTTWTNRPLKYWAIQFHLHLCTRDARYKRLQRLAVDTRNTPWLWQRRRWRRHDMTKDMQTNNIFHI